MRGDQLGLSSRQLVTPEDAASTALVGLLASKAAARKLTQSRAVQRSKKPPMRRCPSGSSGARSFVQLLERVG